MKGCEILIKNLFKKKNDKQTFCEITMDDSDDWVTGLATYLNLSESIIKIFAYDEHLRNNFNNKDKVKIKFIKDNKEFVFKGIVQNKDLSTFEQTMSVSINGIAIFQNSRKNDRYNYKCDVHIRDNKANLTTAVLCDIGQGGALILTDRLIDTNSTIDLEIFALPQESICFTAEVLRRIDMNQNFKYALNIKDIDDDNNKILNKLIVLLSFQKNKLVDEWVLFNKTKLKASMVFSRRKI